MTSGAIKMVRVPTEEQRQVIESDANRFLVSASAGAGKTFVLVERYLWMIEHLGFEPNQILTITFTKKAAAEMKRRIVERLRGLEFYDRAQVADTGPIQTIHSFCERLLRENSLAAGIDPDFEIMDDGERARLEGQAIASALASVPKEHPDAETLIRYLAGQREYGGSSPYSRIENAVAKVLSGLRGTHTKLADLQEMATVSGVRESLHSHLIGSLPEQVVEGARFVTEPKLADRLAKSFKSHGLKAPQFLRGIGSEEAEEESMAHTAGLLQLSAHAWGHLEFEMGRRQRFDYALLESKAVQVLQESAVTRDRLREQYSAVMVDEAQDVNPVQHILIDALSTERAMIVGDIKQSIYGFRLADVQIFRDREQELQTLRLTKNWRSEPGILKFVDDFFEIVWEGDYQPMGELPEFDPEVVELPSYPGVEVWELVDRDISQVARWITEMQAESGRPMRDIAVLVRSRKFALDLLQRLERLGVRSRIVGGTDKFYVRLEIRDLANILQALANPYDDFALIAALRSPLGGVSVDTVARLALEKPVIESLDKELSISPEDARQLAKFKAWFLPLSKTADRLSAWEVLSAIIAKSDYMAELAASPGAERTLANVRKLLTLAVKEPELGPAEFANQIRDIQRLAHKEGDAPSDDEDADTLTIMTIHSAKGLEFETVVLPDVHRQLSGRSGPVEVDGKLGLVATKFGREESLYHKWLTNLRKDRDVAEEMRVLYVAMTRARQRLCIVAHPKARNYGSIAAIVGRHMNWGSTPPLGLTIRTPGKPESD